ncbi:hypothetical protein [Actinomadura macrotermitis]|uniref:Uncharacterized protein n=1 Tax=Actinomadura macrotermitis TaxID=2585200 RepID=A0A7K0C2Y2_9ACTN|nr:hypothetical protein [Actinomadura macrotermitis]MQY07184.1 hypothetical protein [Actinomadura macrotermitis]
MSGYPVYMVLLKTSGARRAMRRVAAQPHALQAVADELHDDLGKVRDPVERARLLGMAEGLERASRQVHQAIMDGYGLWPQWDRRTAGRP